MFPQGKEDEFGQALVELEALRKEKMANEQFFKELGVKHGTEKKQQEEALAAAKVLY